MLSLLFLQLLQLRLCRLSVPVQRRHLLVDTGFSFGNPCPFLLLLVNLAPDRFLARMEMLGISAHGANRLLRHLNLGFQLIGNHIAAGDLIAGILDRLIQLLQLSSELLVGILRLLVFLRRTIQIVLCNAKLLLQILKLGHGLPVLHQEEIDIQILQFFMRFQINLSLFGLLLQRTDLALQLCQNVIDTDQIRLFIFKLLDGQLLTALEFYNSCSLVKQLPSVLRLVGKDLLDLTLSDDGIAFLADTGIIKQLLYIAQAHLHIVQEIFTLAAPVKSSRDRHFLIVYRELMIRVVEGNGYICTGQRFPQLGSRKNNILHGASAQLLDPLLSEHPAHRIGNIGFPGAVRSHNRRKAVMEFQLDFVCKRLKALNLNTF